MAFCSNCGMQIEDKAKFCPFCGSQIAAQTPVEPAPAETKNTFAERKEYTIPEAEVAKEVEISAYEAEETLGRETKTRPDPAPEVNTGTFAPAPEVNIGTFAPAPEVNTNAFAYNPAPERSSGTLNVGMLVWSILNLLFCCLPVAIASLIFTISAKDAATATEEAKKLKTAKTLNLIATIGGAIFMILYIVLFVALVMLGVMGGTGAI